MKIQMRVSDKTGMWGEEFNVPEVHSLEDAEKWAKELIVRFNKTRRPGENIRTLVDVQLLLDEKSKKTGATLSHDWEKTNLVTIIRNGLVYDTVRCSRCGITGKRYGVSGVTIDPKYRAKKYRHCTEQETNHE